MNLKKRGTNLSCGIAQIKVILEINSPNIGKAEFNSMSDSETNSVSVLPCVGGVTCLGLSNGCSSSTLTLQHKYVKGMSLVALLKANFQEM